MKGARLGVLLGVALFVVGLVRADQPSSGAAPGDEATVVRQLSFAAGSTRLKDEAEGQQSLRRLSQFLALHREISKVTLEGHTNNDGTREANLALSRARAAAVRDELVKLGVEAERLDIVGFGQLKPIADNTTAVGRARNDRLDIRWTTPPPSQSLPSPAEPGSVKAGVVDKYGGHYGSDGFYYDRFGGHYDQYGYEFKDGSYKGRCGVRYDRKSNKVFDVDGTEIQLSATLQAPDDKKGYVKVYCQIAAIDAAEKAKEAKKSAQARAKKAKGAK